MPARPEKGEVNLIKACEKPHTPLIIRHISGIEYVWVWKISPGIPVFGFVLNDNHKIYIIAIIILCIIIITISSPQSISMSPTISITIFDFDDLDSDLRVLFLGMVSLYIGSYRTSLNGMKTKTTLRQICLVLLNNTLLCVRSTWSNVVASICWGSGREPAPWAGHPFLHALYLSYLALTLHCPLSKRRVPST